MNDAAEDVVDQEVTVKEAIVAGTLVKARKVALQESSHLHSVVGSAVDVGLLQLPLRRYAERLCDRRDDHSKRHLRLRWRESLAMRLT